jgi:hypothetical protein
MKRASTGSPPILNPEANMKVSDEDQHSSPPKLIAIVNKSKKGCPNPSCPPQLKAKPVSDINYKTLLSVQTPPNCMESTSRRNSSPPILEAKPIFEIKAEKNFSVATSCKPPKLKVKPTQIQNESSKQLNPDQPPTNVLVEPVSPSGREKVEVSVSSPGPPKLSPI